MHRFGYLQKAERALEFYKGCKDKSEAEEKAFYKEFDRMKSIANERHTEEKIKASDFCKLNDNFPLFESIIDFLLNSYSASKCSERFGHLFCVERIFAINGKSYD